MPGFLLPVNAVMHCSHSAPITTIPTQPRVLVSGQPVATANNRFMVTGCPFTLPTTPPKPQPCVLVQWTMLSTRILVNGLPVVLQTGIGPGAGLCQSAEQIPQGPPTVAATQTKVSGI